jgi:acetyl-CoA carboxylase biotin carboxyl carrier protein
MTLRPFDAEAVRELAAVLTESGLTEIEIETKDGRIRIARTAAPIAAPPAVVPPEPPASSAPPPPSPGAEEVVHPGAVLSPMVGVAYLSPEPGATPYVALGQTVSAGQTLLLIEAMKTFNQIKATKAGIVTRVLIESGQPVEYGQPLLIVE